MWSWSSVWILVANALGLGILGGTVWAAISETIYQAHLPGGGISLLPVVFAALIGGVQGLGGGIVAAIATIAIVAIVDRRFQLRAWIRALVVGIAVAIATVGYMLWLTRYPSSLTTAATFIGPALVFGTAATLYLYWWGKKIDKARNAQ
jgi:hypothetical protein